MLGIGTMPEHATTGATTVGQRIEIDGTRLVDDSLIVSTNRSLTGVNGEGYESLESTAGVKSFGAKAANAVLTSDSAIARVYVDSNVLVITRDGGWDDDAVASVSKVIEDFFLFYPEAA